MDPLVAPTTADHPHSSPRVVRSRIVHAPAPLVWDLIGNLHRHERLIPLTTVDAPDRVTRPGDLIVARTAGVLVDRMATIAVREIGTDPARQTWGRWATFIKHGPVLVGEAHLVVRPRGRDATLVVWAEDVSFALSIPGLTWPLDLSLGLMSDLALLRLDAALR